MNAIVVGIARNTVREGVRDRIFFAVGIFALFVLGSSLLIGPLSLGEQVRIVEDLGLAAISVMGLLIAVLVGTSIVSKEIDRRTIYTVISKPVERWQFVVGKFLGLAAIVSMMIAGMTVLLVVIDLGVARQINAQVLVAVFLTWMELLLLTALSVLMSTLASPVLGAIFSLLLYVIGHASTDIRELAVRFGSGAIRLATDVVYYAVPNLEYLNVRGKVTHGIQIDPGYVAFASSYALLYSLAFLVIAVLVFQRKEFK